MIITREMKDFPSLSCVKNKVWIPFNKVAVFTSYFNDSKIANQICPNRKIVVSMSRRCRLKTEEVYNSESSYSEMN